MSVTTTETVEGGEVVISVSGRFDGSCYDEISGACRAYPRGQRRFVVDLSDTESMDSSAMLCLLELRDHSDKAAGVALINSKGKVREILHIASFDKLFTVV